MRRPRVRFFEGLMQMRGESSVNDGRKTVEVKVVLEREVYELVERISGKLGMDPSSWIRLVLSSKVKGESEMTC